jgi:CBS domain containing-hemolysin-like protein
MSDYNIAWGIIITSLVLSALFSGSEIAFISSNKLYIALQRKKGAWAAYILERFTKTPSHFIATMLVGNTITLVVYGIFMASVLDPWLMAVLPLWANNDISVLVLQTLLSTLLVLVTAEFLPKSLFLISPNQVLNVLALPLMFFYTVLYPFVWMTMQFSKVLFRWVLRVEYTEDRPVFGLLDLNHYINNLSTASPNRENFTEEQPEVDTKLFSNALLLRTLRVRECMVPRPDITAVDVNEEVEYLKQTFVDSGHSKVLVYQESIDDIIGYCHSSQLFNRPQHIREILTPIIVVTESSPAEVALLKMISASKSLALVVDEFGGTAGIVSIEDIVEEIFGEIEDEYDNETLEEEQIDERTFIFNARLEVDYLNERYALNLPEGDYDTLSGLILYLHEDIPEAGVVINHEHFRLTILALEDNARISRVKLELLSEA